MNKVSETTLELLWFPPLFSADLIGLSQLLQMDFEDNALNELREACCHPAVALHAISKRGREAFFNAPQR